jgi:16S rRNA (adenine1518-N6/adenine1519-N6)-dimethyltransferase
VVAVEADADLIGPLQDKFGDQITLIHGDILSSAISPQLPATPYKLVANIPYNITSDFLTLFLTGFHPRLSLDPDRSKTKSWTVLRPTRMILMLQREVADRITAAPPDMSLLSIVCQLYADVRKVASVPRGAFRPMPKVESAVVRLDLTGYPHPGSGYDPERVIRLAKIGFSHPRKQLHRNLSDTGVAESDRIKAVLTGLGLPPTARAENLTVEQWKTLYSALS